MQNGIRKCGVCVVFVYLFVFNHVSDRLVGGINFNSGIFSRKQKLLWYFFYLCEVQRMHTLLVSPWSTWSWQPGMTLDSKSRAWCSLDGVTPSALRSHSVLGGGSWLGEEPLSLFLRRAAAGSRMSTAEETEGAGGCGVHRPRTGP